MKWLHYIGQPAQFTIEVQPAANYPVDLYYLMDVSFSMRDDLDIMKDVMNTIGKTTTIIVLEIRNDRLLKSLMSYYEMMITFTWYTCILSLYYSKWNAIVIESQ